MGEVEGKAGVAERRRCFRAQLAASATIRGTRRTARGREVEDLSLGGARIAGAPPVRVGEAVAVTIRLAGERQITQRAVVVREWPRGHSRGFAIAFTELTPSAEDIIHDAIVRSIETDAVATVLIVDPDRARRRSLSRQLRGLGYRTIGVPTPIEAIDAVDSHGGCIQAAVVHSHLTQTTGVELALFFRDAFPQMRRVLTVDEQDSTDARAAVRCGYIHCAVSAPWRRRELSSALTEARRGEIVRAPRRPVDSRRAPGGREVR